MDNETTDLIAEFAIEIDEVNASSHEQLEQTADLIRETLESLGFAANVTYNVFED